MTKLGEPITIKGMEIKNRIAWAPILTMPTAEDGRHARKFHLAALTYK